MKNIKDKIPDITNLATKTTLNAKINEIRGKIPSITNLATKTALNAVEYKIPSVSNLVKKLIITQKLMKLNTTPEFNKLTSEHFAARLKQIWWSKLNYKLTSFNNRITSNKTKKLEVEKKLDSLIIKYFFFGRIYFPSNDGSQNVFVYQPTFDVLELKTEKGTEYIIGWKAKGLYSSKLTALLVAFLSNVKYFGIKIGIQFNTLLVAEQKNYSSENVYTVYDLDNWPNNPLRSFTLKNCLFGACNIGKNNDKEKYVYSGHGISFNGNGEWSFGNDFARNVIIFGVDHSSSSHTDNLKNDF